MATEVKCLSDTLRMIRNCEISPQRAREEVRFLINLIDVRIAAAKAKPPAIDVNEWADKWQKATDEHDGPMRGRRAVQIQFALDLIRAAIGADKAEPVIRRVESPPFAFDEDKPEQPAPAPVGYVPEWFLPHESLSWRFEEWKKVESELARRVAESNTAAEHRIAQRDAEIERLKSELAKWESEPVGKMITELRDEERESKNREIAKLRAELAESRKSGRAACESLADCIALKDKRTEERDKLKAELAEAKKRALPAGWEMSGTMVSRQDECERLTKENATLREQLAEATKPVEDREIDERTASVPVNTYGHCFVGVLSATSKNLSNASVPPGSPRSDA